MTAKPILGGLFLMTAVQATAWINLDFETVVQTPFEGGLEVVGWEHYSAIAMPVDDMINLSEWAEAVLMPTVFMGEPIAGSHSVAFYSAYAAWVTSRDQFPGWVDMGYTGDEQIGRASIGQTGTLGGAQSRLTFVTNYTGPRESMEGTDPLRWGLGEMVISFDGHPLGFTLEPEEISGRLLTRAWVDLSAFVGQTGELRIGVEGPHSFAIDNLRLVPEGRGWVAMLGLGVAGAWAFARKEGKRSA